MRDAAMNLPCRDIEAFVVQRAACIGLAASKFMDQASSEQELEQILDDYRREVMDFATPLLVLFPESKQKSIVYGLCENAHLLRHYLRARSNVLPGKSRLKVCK